MHALIESHRAQIEALCRRYAVRRLDVFGSLTRPDFDIGRSDADLVVSFDKSGTVDVVHQYFGFKEEMETLLKRPVDLVELDAMQNTRLKRIIERTKVPLYAAAA